MKKKRRSIYGGITTPLCFTRIVRRKKVEDEDK
jgi:hypothetical protein